MHSHSSQIRGLRSTKCSSETLQNLLYFMYEKTHVVFLYIKYSKFWSVLLEHFVEHKHLIFEEWSVENLHTITITYRGFNWSLWKFMKMGRQNEGVQNWLLITLCILPQNTFMYAYSVVYDCFASLFDNY